MLSILQKDVIAAEVMRSMSPSMEALHPFCGLKKVLQRKVGQSDPKTRSESLIATLVPLVDNLVQSGLVNAEDAKDFSLEIMSAFIEPVSGRRVFE